MAAELNHTIVPAHDPRASAQFLAGILGLPVAPPVAHFTPVTLPAASPARSMPARTAAADSVAAAITRDGGKAMTATGDVTDFGQVESVRRQIEDAWEPVDILVANAGGSFTPPAPLEQIPEDGWRATVDGNLLATFLTLKSFLPGMNGTPQDVATAAAFLASDQAAWITGVVVDVAGGAVLV